MATTITCLIIEDEPAAQTVLLQYVKNVPQLELKGVFSSSIEANAFLTENAIDLLFLDINMPGLSGIGLLKSLKVVPAVIFTTAYTEHAVEGFNLDAIDYLLKPYPFERFLKAFNKYLDSVQNSSPNVDLFLQSDKKLVRMPISDIVYLEAYGDYVKVVALNQNLVVHKTLSAFEKELPENKFIRIHRSFIIALEHFDHVEGNSVFAKGKSLPIGQTFRKSFFEKLP